MTTLDNLFFILELIGTVAFSASGAFTALRKNMDLFGVCMLGLITAVGGGVIRDVVLGNTPPDTFRNPIYALVAILTALIVFLPHKRRGQRTYEVILFGMDTVGLAIFTVVGIRAAQLHVEDPTLSLIVFVGVTTGVGGGVLRDVLAGDLPYIFVRHVYASACLAGALICGLMWETCTSLAAMLAGMGIVCFIRVLSAHYRWNLPKQRQAE